MISPPKTHTLSICLRRVFRERPDATRCSRNGRKQATSFSPGGKSFFESHPGAGPIGEIAAVAGKIQMRTRGRAVYGGGFRCLRHGTDHDSKPMSSFSGIRLSPRPFQPRQESHRNRRPAACAICSATTCKPSALIFSKKSSSSSGTTTRLPGPECSWTSGAIRLCAPGSSP